MVSTRKEVDTMEEKLDKRARRRHGPELKQQGGGMPAAGHLGSGSGAGPWAECEHGAPMAGASAPGTNNNWLQWPDPPSHRCPLNPLPVPAQVR